MLVTGQTGEGEASFEQLFGERARGLRLLRLGRLERRPSLWGDLITLFELIALMRRERPNIVHTHTAKAGVLGRLAALLTGVPVIVHTFHGHVLRGYFSRPISAAIAFVERLLALGSSALVTLSPALARELVEQFRLAPRRRFRIIPLGRDLADFKEAAQHRGALRRELGISDARIKLISCVGRLVPIKDHDTLLQAFAKLAASARLVIVGEGECGEQLRARAERLGLGARVHFLGWRADLARIYADTDVLALSSRNEGTPLAIIEAFAAGCPVVATRVGGVPDMFAPEANGASAGVLVPAADAGALAQALAGLLADDDGRARCAQAARRAAEGYSAERLAERVAGLYRELLARRR